MERGVGEAGAVRRGGGFDVVSCLLIWRRGPTRASASDTHHSQERSTSTPNTGDKLRGGGGAAVSGNRRAHEENSEPVP